jgi:hypothetical protein
MQVGGFDSGYNHATLNDRNTDINSKRLTSTRGNVLDVVN